MQEDRSQHRNRAKAMAVLRARLYDHERQKLDAARAAERRGQVGSGDRSERIRTYNFPQGRVSDHRINLTLYKLPQIIEGEALGEIIDALVTEHQAELLAAESLVMATAAADTALSVAAARRSCCAVVPRGRPRHARARCAHPGRPCARARPCRRLPRRRTPPDHREAEAIAALARRRLAREPVARIVGDEGILGPAVRAQCRHAGAAAGDRDRGRGGACRARATTAARALRIADLGTGSGALLLALLSELPAAHGVGTDISLAALACARANAAALGLAGRASFVACDQGAALVGGFDLVVANPPYVARGEIASLQPEVRDYDPRRALDGGADGLAAYRAIAADARRLLAPQACWCSNSAPVNSTPSRSLTPRLGSRRRRLPAAIWPGCPARSPSRLRHKLRSAQMQEPACLSTIQARKKALGLWAKTDYVRLRNRSQAALSKSPQRRFGEPKARRRERQGRTPATGSSFWDRDASSVTAPPAMGSDAALRMTRGGQHRREGCGQGVAASRHEIRRLRHAVPRSGRRA